MTFKSRTWEARMDDLDELDKKLTERDNKMFTCEKCGHKGYARPECKRPLGFVSDEPVEPGATVKVTTRPQLIFKGERVYIAPNVGECFEIDDIHIGYNSQVALPAKPIPGLAFSQQKEEEDDGRSFEFDVAQIGQDFTFIVKNTSSKPLYFKAVVFGYDCGIR